MKPLWEQEDFQRVAGEIWRPGGPELTRRALELAENYELDLTAVRTGPMP